MAITIILILSIFYFFITLGFLLGWHSLRDPNIIGGIILMWVFLIVFFLVIFFAARNRTAPTPTAALPNYVAIETAM